jgi:hypothetical protein
MRKIDYNLSPYHPLNKEAAAALGRKWSEKHRMYVNADGSLPADCEDPPDKPWNRLSKSDKVHAHK